MDRTTRRDFLKKAGLLSAVSVVSPAALIPAAGSSREAYSGAGKVTAGHTRHTGGRIEMEWEDFNGILKHTFTISGSSRSSTPIVLTRLSYDGYTGYGEAAMPPYLGETAASVNGFLQRVRKEVLPGFNDPFRIQEIMEETDRLAAGNTAAKASVDIALHDLTGKIMGQPWWKIWGFSPEKTPYTSFTIGYDDDDDTVRAKTGEASWTKVLKVKLGMGDEKDRRMVRLVREVNGTAPLYVDANQGWTDRERALDMIYWLKGQGAVLVEQPMSKYDLDSHAWLTERSPLPIIADEACQRLTDIPRLKGAFHGINIKLMKCTGMREAREMITLSRALGMRLMIGCMTETSVAISAAAQLCPEMEWADLDGNLLLANDCFDGMKIRNGKITLDERPGIGVTEK
ncbi:MAG: dipeptide epimerase [Bacteroidetes bacterium]|uniref:Dipeptide epimerase n=1 Tax=Candidatus Cryptobacteroides intestinavium TaxID=2840766 RepID=A0A9D9ERQ7_9BACT|nr:dipeptide epimerase [Candidatus Cryptobacteroides intestinavium]